MNKKCCVVTLLLFFVGLCEAVQVTVSGGSESGSYIEGDRFFVVANDPVTGQVFSHWSGDTANLGMADSPITMLTVPSSDMAISANYRDVGLTVTTIDSADYMNLDESNRWVHTKYENDESGGGDHVTINTSTCLGEQLFNGSMAHAVEELMNGQPFETSYYGLNNSAFMEGSYDPRDDSSMVWEDGYEVLLLTNSFTDGVAYSLTCAFADNPGNLIPYTLRLIPGETITVPAGTYTCVRSQIYIPMFQWFSEEWFAPGVGKVKGHSAEIGNGEYIWELEQYVEGGGEPGADPVEILTASLPAGIVGVDYTSAVTATNGATPYTWSVSGLPAGLTMSAAGLISGAPMIAFSNAVSFTVTDDLGETNATSLLFVVPIDADGDSLPDEWEFTRFGHVSNCVATADADGDGHSNLKEYLCGTNPTNSASVLAVQMTVSGATNQLSWFGISNYFYQLEYTDSLASTNWIPMDFSVVNGSNETAIQYDLEALSNRFYRVKVSDDQSIFPEPPSSGPEGMVLIPGGTNSGTDPDFGAYSLTVDAFYMGTTEVTKEQWNDVYSWARTNGYDFTIGFGKAANHPVRNVHWYDCVKWCNARSEMEGRTPVYTVDENVYRTGYSSPLQNSLANGYRLPTNTEWEYAARGGFSDRRFPEGNTISHSQVNYESYWSGGAPYYSYDVSPTSGNHPTYASGVVPYTSPAESFSANGYGLYGMSGNMFEWCWDSSGSSRSSRGGSWDHMAYYARCGCVKWSPPNDNRSYFGLRVICRDQDSLL